MKSDCFRVLFNGAMKVLQNPGLRFVEELLLNMLPYLEVGNLNFLRNSCFENFRKTQVWWSSTLVMFLGGKKREHCNEIDQLAFTATNMLSRKSYFSQRK